MLPYAAAYATCYLVVYLDETSQIAFVPTTVRVKWHTVAKPGWGESFTY